MKPPSPETRRLVQALLDLDLWSGRPVPKSMRVDQQKRAESLLRDIVSRQEWTAIRDIAPLAFEADCKVAAHVASAMGHILQRLAPLDVAKLDIHLRQRSMEYDMESSPWHRMSPRIFRKVSKLPWCNTAMLALCSFHMNGYVREQAVRKLSAINDGSEVPFILIRLNDWVPAVRNVAKKSVRDRLRPEYAIHFGAALPLILRLEKCSRDDHMGLLNEVLALLKSDRGQAGLWKAVRSRDNATRRAGYRTVLTSTTMDLSRIIQHGVGDRDPLVRRMLAEKADEFCNENTLRLLIEKIENDPVPSVRRIALSLVVRKSSDEADARLWKALLDPCASIRHEARYYLRERGNPDFRSFYHRVLGKRNEKTLSGAVSGLGETGSPEDVGLVLPFLDHPTPRIRKLAIRSVAKLDLRGNVDRLTEMLSDGSPKVSREAGKVLIDAKIRVSPRRVWGIFRAERKEHVQVNALFLMARIPRWDSIRYLLEALSVPNEKIKNRAIQYLDRWLAASASAYSLRPASKQLDEAFQAFSEFAFHLDSDRRKELEFALKSVDARSTG